MRRVLQYTSVLGIGALLLTGLTGCTPVPPPPESVLAGTWKLTGDLVDQEVGDFLIHFDDSGTITSLTYILNQVTIGPELVVRASSQVTGLNVSISATWDGGSTLFFEGLMNAMETRIDGEASFRIVINPPVSVAIPPGPATLTRQ